jgi:hypothetical protein
MNTRQMLMRRRMEGNTLNKTTQTTQQNTRQQSTTPHDATRHDRTQRQDGRVRPQHDTTEHSDRTGE